MSTYADTSFLVSLYVFDVNSVTAATNLPRLPSPLFLTPLLETEIANAFQLRIFRKHSSEGKIHSSAEVFGRDVRAGVFDLRSFTTEMFRQAAEIAKQRTAELGTRTLDLLHVASALVLEADVFCTFDRSQEKLAAAEGLRVIRL